MTIKKNMDRVSPGDTIKLIQTTSKSLLEHIKLENIGTVQSIAMVRETEEVERHWIVRVHWQNGFDGPLILGAGSNDRFEIIDG